MKEKEELYHIEEPTLIASVLEGLISITFADTKEERELFKKPLEFKLSMLMPKSLDTSKDKLLCTLIVFSAGYAEIEEVEIKALQMLKNIGLGVDLDMELKELDGLRTYLDIK